jgi:hypothetical protein
MPGFAKPLQNGHACLPRPRPTMHVALRASSPLAKPTKRPCCRTPPRSPTPTQTARRPAARPVGHNPTQTAAPSSRTPRVRHARQNGPAARPVGHNPTQTAAPSSRTPPVRHTRPKQPRRPAARARSRQPTKTPRHLAASSYPPNGRAAPPHAPRSPQPHQNE